MPRLSVDPDPSSPVPLNLRRFAAGLPNGVTVIWPQPIDPSYGSILAQSGRARLCDGWTPGAWDHTLFLVFSAEGLEDEVVVLAEDRWAASAKQIAAKRARIDAAFGSGATDLIVASRSLRDLKRDGGCALMFT